MFKNRRHLLRGLLTGVLVAVVTFSSMGFHLAIVDPHAQTAPVHGDEWYPCKDHHCGCVSAEMCRTACCCGFSEAEPEDEDADSCCAAEDDEQPAVTMTIQSARCHGRDLSLMLAAIHWTTERPGVCFIHHAPAGYVHAASTLFVDLADPFIDTPPPRGV